MYYSFSNDSKYAKDVFHFCWLLNIYYNILTETSVDLEQV
jgi:hypothetical protein